MNLELIELQMIYYYGKDLRNRRVSNAKFSFCINDN
jgi:hypothetical protein